MGWFQFALLCLQISNNLINWLREKNQLDAGRDQEIAKISASILLKTNSAKAVMEEISGLPGPDLDVLLHKLEPTD